MRQIESIFKNITIVLMAVVIVSVTLQIVAREFIYFPVSWTQEVAKYSFIWMTLIGAALGVKNATHVSIDILVTNFPIKVQKFSKYFVEICIIFFMSFLLIQSIKFIGDASGQTSPILDLHMGVVYLSLILFALLSILFSLEKIVRINRKRSNEIQN